MSLQVPDPERMQQAAREVVEKLRLLANPERLLLLCQLSQGEHCVSQLETLLRIRQPTLSQQLGVLRAEEVVCTRRAGRYVYYRIADEKLMRVLATLYELYCPSEVSDDH